MFCFFFFKQKTAYEMRISDWSSDVCSSDLGDAVDAATQREVIEIDVARLGDRLDHGKPSVTLTLPAVENAVAQSIVAWTVDSVVGAHHAVIEPGEGDCHLEGGARGVLAANRLVEHRAVGVGDAGLPRLRGEPADKGVGVKAGRRGQRQDVAVLDIDHNGRSLSFGRQSPHYGFLEPKIQRRRDVSAGNGGFARKPADRGPPGVDLHIPSAWSAAQRPHPPPSPTP